MNSLKDLKNALNIKLLPNDIKISTITITCKVNTTFNNLHIEKYLDLDNEIVTIKSLRVNKTSLNVKKTRKKKISKFKKNAFYNQVSIGLKKTDINLLQKGFKGIINVKLFINGAIQITGCKSYEDFKWALTTLFQKLSVIKATYDGIEKIIIDKPFCGNIDILKLENIERIKVAMINSNFHIGYSINRENLYGLLNNNKIMCSYDPVIHACVNIKYTHNLKKLSIFVFEKGVIIITGANHCDQIIPAYQFIKAYLDKNYNNLAKNTYEVKDDLITQILKRKNIKL